MKSYFISLHDDSAKKVEVNIVNIRIYFPDLHYGKKMTTIQFDKGHTIMVQESPEDITSLINLAQKD